MLDRSDNTAQEERPIEALRRRQQEAKANAMKSVSGGSAKSRPKLDTASIAREAERSKAVREKTSRVRGVLVTLLLTIAVAVIVTIYLFPALILKGESMEPGLSSGQIVLAVKFGDCSYGDLMAFSYDNEIMVKRVIALGGDRVDMNENGVVFVNGQPVDEPYVQALDLGQCDIEFPYVVPDGKYFVLGDNRPVSRDSRHNDIGTVAESQIVGKLGFRIWPLNTIGPVS